MSKSFVYFIQNDRTFSIKIGVSVDVKRRLSALQTATQDRLQVVGVMSGGGDLEREMHEKFAHLRLSGEWFSVSPMLLEFVSKNTEPYDPHKHCGDRHAGTLTRVAEKVRELICDIAGDAGTDRQKEMRAFERIVERFPHWTLNRVHDLHTMDARCRLWADELAELEEVANEVGTVTLNLRDFEEVKAKLTFCQSAIGKLMTERGAVDHGEG
jgi:hypothetical protein